ncbi:hypothetical protein TTHERM_00456890 (macronuclear) [Tetrahymena thermophila SB210]|uniref:FAM13A-like domain-containing protein n=1 Tax=Tetrahymena thermophila (strain SB210) TaxID=312017 RepID=I7MM47_TETTS|nr:hypothetical protein TTHERM_00456890 [Tetrahymena thermophila SB210]EAS03951.1 hypothetical protein TTHERM_00456890 [Tetrahymena thermophila SB210]|eukprot:XP_001024196.1 hypothetical protein TTHERM_00456890 [Tetrahymena thermophila SB210]
MELDILNEIFSTTVGDFFNHSNKYNIFSSSSTMRNQFNLNNNGKNQNLIRQSQNAGQPMAGESAGAIQSQLKVLQTNQPSHNLIAQQLKQLQPVSKQISQQTNLQSNNSFGNANGNQLIATGIENKKLVSMSLNSSIQSSLLDQSSNQLNISKDSIQRGSVGGVNSSLNTSFNNIKSSNTNESLIHSSQNVFRDSTNSLRTSHGQFVNNFVGGGAQQQYPQQNNQHLFNGQINNNLLGQNSNNNINSHLNQNQYHQGNLGSQGLQYQQQQILQQNNLMQNASNNSNHQQAGINSKQNGILINNFTNQNKNQIGENSQLTPEEEWIRIEAPKKLEESMKRLGLDNQRITQRLIKEMSYEQLQTEKKRVKNELKLYDQAFENYFNVQPTRNQKEPMRPLYVYYKGLKQALSKGQNENKTSSIHISQQQNTSINQGLKQLNNQNVISSSVPSSAQTSIQLGINSHQTSHNDSFDIHNPNHKQNVNSLNTSLNAGNNGVNSKILQASNQQQRVGISQNRDVRKSNKDIIDKNSYKDIMNIVQEQKENFNNGLIQHLGSQQSLQQLNGINNQINNSNNATIKEQQKLIEQKINLMKRKRVQLREQLQVYQDDFYRTHNRKIKYHRDILPVENEYKEYKDIKKEIIKLEQMLQQQPLV